MHPRENSQEEVGLFLTKTRNVLSWLQRKKEHVKLKKNKKPVKLEKNKERVVLGKICVKSYKKKRIHTRTFMHLENIEKKRNITYVYTSETHYMTMSDILL